MAIFRRLLGFGIRNSAAASLTTGLQSSIPLSYGTDAASSVTVDTALQLSATWACVRLLTESISTLPINFYRKVDGVRVAYPEHPLSLLLNGKPNRIQNRIEFLMTMTMQRVLLGNAYALISRNGQGQIVSLQPMMAEQMEVSLQEDGSVVYQYQDGANFKFYGADKIWHWKGLGNGVIGLSPLDYMRNSVGIAQAAENRVSKIYSNGAKPSGVLTIDKVLTEAQRAAIKTNFQGLEEGSEDRLFVLEAGMQYQQISMSPQDIELLSTRRFQTEDIARYFGVPSVLINDTQATTAWGSGIQQIVQGFYKLGLRPYLESLEASIVSTLLPLEERRSVEVEFDFNALLMPDESERVKMYKEAVTGGLYTPNEIRVREGMSRLDGGDTIYMQQQMTPLDMLGQQQVVKEETKSAEHSSVTVNMPAISVMPPNVSIKNGDITIPSTVNMPPIELTMPEIKVDAPNVTVEAPTVNIEQPKIDVAAPNVSVTPEIKVKLPKRRSNTKVKYNKDGVIESTEQIEEDM